MASFKHVDGREVARALCDRRQSAYGTEKLAIELFTEFLADRLAHRHDWTDSEKQEWLLLAELGPPRRP